MNQPNEQEWWRDKKYYTKWDVECGRYAKVEKIVAEAERRGRVAAWEEATEYVHRNLESMADIQEEKMLYDAAEEMYKKMETKLSALSNSQEKDV